MAKFSDPKAREAKSFVSNSTLQLVLVYNFILLSLAIPFIASGTSYKFLINLIPNYFPTVVDVIAIFLITAGSLITFLSLIGFFFYEENSKAWIQGYMWLTFLIMNVCIVLLVILHVYNVKTDGDTPESYLQSKFENYRNETHVQVETDRLQHKFSCCGINGPSDYKTTLNMIQLPSTCCDSSVNFCTVRSSGLHKQGCLGPLEDYIHHVFKLGLTITIILCVCMGLFNIFAIYIEMKIWKEIRMIELLL